MRALAYFENEESNDKSFVIYAFDAKSGKFRCVSKSKTQVGGKVTKLYDDPTTPYQRLITSNSLEQTELDKLQAQFKTMNPFEMKKELDEKLKWFFKITEIRAKSTSEAG